MTHERDHDRPQRSSILEQLEPTSRAVLAADSASYGAALTEGPWRRRGLLRRLVRPS